MKKQRILFLSSSSGFSGAEVVLINLLRTMDKERFEVSVFSNVNNLLLVERLRDLAVGFKTSSRFPDPEITGKTGLGLSKVFTYVSSIIQVGTELISYLRKNPFDLIHANGYPDCLYCLFPAWRAGIPLTWHLHDMRPIHSKNAWVYRLAGRLSAKSIAVSEACRLNLLRSRIPASKVVTVYNGIDLHQFKEDPNGPSVREELGISSGAKVIGLLGQPLPEKGHSFFIEAAAEVVRVFPETRFLIVGYVYPSAYQRSLENLVNNLYLHQHVLFTGWRGDVPRVMAAVDVLVHARITPEPAALVLLEAMAMGKPVVCSATGGSPELVLDRVTGILVPPRDSRAIAEGVLHLLRNPDLADQMGRNGRKRVEETFALDTQTRKVCDVFAEVMGLE